MLNARTWHRLCISAYIIFPAVIIGWMIPEDSILVWPVAIAIAWGILVAFLGAIQGIMLACGRLYVGCPTCNAKSHVLGGDRDGMCLDCPNCGELRLKPGGLFRLKAIQCGSDEDELADYHPDSHSPLLAPKRHWIPFLIIYLPVVGSVIAASAIHKFMFFYLLIPGFWCFAVGGVILDGIFSGSISDNHGTALRSKSPFRFWGKIGIWSIAYLLAAAFPIGFALQERAKNAINSEQGGAGQPAMRHELKSEGSRKAQREAKRRPR